MDPEDKTQTYINTLTAGLVSYRDARIALERLYRGVATKADYLLCLELQKFLFRKP